MLKNKDKVRRWQWKVYSICYVASYLGFLVMWIGSKGTEDALPITIFPMLVMLVPILPIMILTLYSTMCHLEKEVEILKEQMESLKSDGSEN